MKKMLLGGMALILSQSIQALPYFGQTAQSYQTPEPYGDNAPYGHYVSSGSANIYYEVYGKGQPIVLLHGGLVGSIGEMGELIDHLRSNYQVIAISTRGHGRSSVGNEALDYSQKAKDVLAVLQQLHLKQVNIIGFSDGAYTGYYFAYHYPQHIGKLIAIGAGEWQQGWRQFNTPWQQLLNADPNYWQAQLALRPQAEQSEQWYQQQTAAYDQTKIEKDFFAQIHTPTLVLAGEKDQNAPLDTVINAYQALPNAQLGIIANAPHNVLQGHFNATWQQINDFLTSQE